MPEVYITLEEAAELEGIAYATLQKRVKRNPSAFRTKTQPRPGGGKEQVLVSVSSLSAKARKQHKAAQKVDGRDAVIDKRTESAPWYTEADLNEFIEGHSKQYYEAIELARKVQSFIDYEGAEKTAYADRYALGLGISTPTLYRYVKAVLEASAWALKLEKEDGQSRDYFRALALCRKPKEKATFPSLTDEQKAVIENIWFDKSFSANLGTIEMLFEKFEKMAEPRGWENYPGIKTVARYIKHLMASRGAESARYLASNGSRESKNRKMLKAKRDATSLEVMEYVVGDEHTFDFWVQVTLPNGKIKGPAESRLAVREEKFLVGAVVERVIFCVDFSECRDVGRELRSFSKHVRQVECRAKDLIGCSGTLSFNSPLTSIIDRRNSGESEEKLVHRKQVCQVV